MQHTKSLFFIVFLCSAIFVFPGLAEAGGGSEPAALEPGRVVEDVLRPGEDNGRHHTYVLDFPPDASVLSIRLLEASADLDLFLRYGEPMMGDYSQADYYSEKDLWTEDITIYKIHGAPMLAGRYYLDVCYQLDSMPRKDGDILWNVPYRLEYSIVDAGSRSQSLTDGEPLEFTLDAQGFYIGHFSMNVPNGQGFRVDILDTPGDMDLYLSHRGPASERDDYVRIADTNLGRESIVVPPGEARSGTYYLTVKESAADDYPVSGTVLFSTGTEAPDQLPGPPVPQIGEGPLEEQMLASVQLIGEAVMGSGCIVSPDGILLTNYHIVVDDNDNLLDPLVVSMVIDPYEAPEESFLAEVLDSSPRDDLAILRITGDRWGRPLPQGYRFPYWRIGDPLSLRLGDPLQLLGYPWMGSGLSRPYVTLTRGVLSGGERTPDGLILKSDAMTAGGSSGSAVSDENGLLLGLPSFTVGQDASQLMFFVPITRVPRDWRQWF